jgi:NAD(P)-dependent dehydrogenase (short-subunit alcohol dehydrogenase family)
MLSSGDEGWMVNTASTTGLVMGGNMYGITKHAVVALTETAYQELKRRGAKVGISVLCPGLVDTRLFEGSRNRPAELRNDPSAPLPEPRRILQGAMPPSQVADIVLQAIQDEQFYILTDRDWDERIVTRHQNVMARRNPEVPPALR